MNIKKEDYPDRIYWIICFWKFGFVIAYAKDGKWTRNGVKAKIVSKSNLFYCLTIKAWSFNIARKIW